jgi:hypothetical protein
METIEYLLSFVIKLAFGLLLAAAVLWLVGLLYPSFKVSTILSGDVFSRDWLPAPKNYGGLLGSQTNNGGMNGKVYTPGPAYNGYANANGGYTSGSNVDWVIYTATGTQVIKGGQDVRSGVFTGNTTAYAEKSLYVRNLSVYEGGMVSYGTTFVGEARDIMFRNGIFTILVIDKGGKVLSTAQAINTGTWAAPGWARFQATISTRLPPNTDCALVFHSANQSVKVGMFVRCN